MAALENKTKAQLIEIIRLQTQELNRQHEDIKMLEKCKRYEDITDEIKDVHMKFCERGYTHDEALSLIFKLIEQGQIPARLPYRRPMSF